MGTSIIPASSGLPVGATARIGSGLSVSGYAQLTGTFPAGKYLVTSDGPISAHFTTSENLAGYGGYSLNGSAIINVPSATTLIEICGVRSEREWMNTEADYLSGNYVPTQAKANSSSITPGYRWPLTSGSNTAGYDYKGNAIAHSFNIASIAVGPTYGASSGTSGTNTVTNSTGQSVKMATDGTYYMGYYGSGTIWYTTNPLNTNIATVSNVGTTNVGSTNVYGNGTWISYNPGNTAYAYTTSNPTTGWTSGTFPATFYDISFGNGVFVATTSSGLQIYKSTNGTTWTSVYVASPMYNGTNGYWRYISFFNGRFLMTSTTTNNQSTGYGVWQTLISTDGSNWYSGASLPVWASSPAVGLVYTREVGPHAAMVWMAWGSSPAWLLSLIHI